MNRAPIFTSVLGIVVASLTLGVGTLILLGLVVPEHLPSSFRWMSGIVMILYGCYRGLLLFFERKRIAKGGTRAQQ